MRAFAEGWVAPFKGWWFIASRPALWPHAALPVFINIAAAIAIGWVWVATAEPYMLASTQESGTVPFGWATAAVRVLLWIIALPIMLISWRLLAALIGGPFWEALSFRVAALVLGENFEPPENRTWASILWMVIRVETANFLITTVGSLLALAVAFSLPVVGGALAMVLSWWLAGYPFLSYPFDIRGRSWRAKLSHLASDTARTTGFGLAVWLLLVPIITFPFVAPCAIAGATLLYPQPAPDNTSR